MIQPAGTNSILLFPNDDHQEVPLALRSGASVPWGRRGINGGKGGDGDKDRTVGKVHRDNNGTVGEVCRDDNSKGWSWWVVDRGESGGREAPHGWVTLCRTASVWLLWNVLLSRLVVTASATLNPSSLSKGLWVRMLDNSSNVGLSGIGGVGSCSSATDEETSGTAGLGGLAVSGAAVYTIWSGLALLLLMLILLFTAPDAAAALSAAAVVVAAPTRAADSVAAVAADAAADDERGGDRPRATKASRRRKRSESGHEGESEWSGEAGQKTAWMRMRWWWWRGAGWEAAVEGWEEAKGVPGRSTPPASGAYPPRPAPRLFCVRSVSPYLSGKYAFQCVGNQTVTPGRMGGNL
ncbi:hypothetical protein PTTG_07901 [Puccinia triticina 1-1 BBBD Race 1]|uniref:Uncharacterized protein n=1 Tax=Puccinia triticina (isolate 1-1 / race 1 (BBBD)) TaxID=630390 RepID=A0A0C4F467_PUCT1|nr:hypothetical protein PTTG_07901 [Puccinia triticina 1-1 BBBD Race 1]